MKREPVDSKRFSEQTDLVGGGESMGYCKVYINMKFIRQN